MQISEQPWVQDFPAGLAAAQAGDFETARAIWWPLANLGDLQSQYNLGLMCANGHGVPEDDAEAVRWFRLAADQGHAFAQTSLGGMHRNGWGVPQSDVLPYMWFNIAGANGNELGRGNLEIIQNRMTAADISEAQARARVCFNSGYKDCGGAAEQGGARGQFELGRMYANGRGVPVDDSEAVRWYRLAADQGDADAQYSLGNRYRNGEGVPQDYVEAVRWYRLAAEQGDASAQGTLGFMYFKGMGVVQDNNTSYMWFRVAAINGHELARKNSADPRYYLNKDDISKAETRARVCIESNYQDCD